MIEAFWRSLRHQWLYLHSLESFTLLKQLIDFYVREHNTQMPHHAFVGQTPDEVYFDQADRVDDHLRTARRQARRERMEANRGQSCGVCAARSLHPRPEHRPSNNLVPGLQPRRCKHRPRRQSRQPAGRGGPSAEHPGRQGPHVSPRHLASPQGPQPRQEEAPARCGRTTRSRLNRAVSNASAPGTRTAKSLRASVEV